MLVALAIVLAILWLVGLATSYTLGGLIHIFIVLAIIAMLVSFFIGLRPV